MRLQVSYGLVVLLAVAIMVAGCVQPKPADTVPGSVVTEPWIEATPFTQSTVVTISPVHDVASIESDGIQMDPDTGTVYEFTGNVEIYEGIYRSVVVSIRYPDNTTYSYNAGGMGGSNVTKKPFFIYPADRYQSVTPDYYISLDGVNYTTTYRYDDGKTLRVATSDSMVTP